MIGNLCYTRNMQTYNSWAKWAHFLQRYRLEQPAITLLEAAGPLKILFAQLVYIGQPLFGRADSGAWGGFAKLLEDPEESKQFIAFISEEGRS